MIWNEQRLRDENSDYWFVERMHCIYRIQK